MTDLLRTYPVGLYADSTFGHDHIREALAGLVEEFGGDQNLADDLRGRWSDDLSEEDEALDFLNGLSDERTFAMAEGDLLLLGPEAWGTS
jgi:hypothetical protein